MKFSEILQNLRKQQGLSQEELGEKLNVTRQTISKWELGSTSPKLDDLIKISELFNISIDELTGKKAEQIEKQEETSAKKPRKIVLKIFRIIILIIAVLYIFLCLYKFLMLMRAEKEVLQAFHMVQPPASYAFSFTHNESNNILEWKYMLHDGKNEHMLDILNQKYIVFEFPSTSEFVDGKELIDEPVKYTLYDLESKTYTTGVAEDLEHDYFEDIRNYDELVNGVNSNIVPIIGMQLSESKLKTFLFIVNPTTSVFSHKDGLEITKGIYNFSDDFYGFGIEKSNGSIRYMRTNINNKNKADREDVSCMILPKESFEEFISGYNLDEFSEITTLKKSSSTEPYIPEEVKKASNNQEPSKKVEVPGNEENEFDPGKVTIEIISDTVTRKRADILITDNNENKYGWDESFRLQKKENGEWKEVETINEYGLSFIAMGHNLDKNNQLRLTIYYENYYGELENGVYRIVKPVYRNGYIDLFSNEFEIK